MSCVLIIIIITTILLLHTRGCLNSGQKLPRGTRTTWSEAATGKPQGSQETGVTILQTPDTRPFQPQDQEKSAAKNREGSLHGAAGGRISLRGSWGGKWVPEGQGAVGHQQQQQQQPPRYSNLASARTAELGRAGAPGRPRSTAPTSRPAAAAAQPRAGPSPAAAAVAVAAACGGGGAAPPQPDGSGEQSGDGGGGGGANFFRCLLRAPLQRLLTEAGSAVLEGVGARQRPRPGAGASEASRASHEPARPAARAPSSCPPSRPVSRPEGGGPGRAARAGPAGSCSSPPRRVGGSGSEGARGGSAPPAEVPAGHSERGLARDWKDALYSNQPHFAVPL